MAENHIPDVYFLSGEKYDTPSKMSNALNYVLEYRRWSFFRYFWKRQLVGIKPSFSGDPAKCETLFHLINSIGAALKRKDVSAFICDTSNRHKKVSSNALEQIRESYCDCLDITRFDLPIFMLDGINGNYEHIVKRDGRELYLGGELPHLDGIILLSSVIAHPLCGVTGAVYNLGAGLASKRGKIKQRTLTKPRVNVDKCYFCKRCLRACPVNAIAMGDGHVVIDETQCVDCGRCVEIAKRCGISYDWNATPMHFQKMMVEYASAAADLLGRKAIFINLIAAADGAIEGLLVSRDSL
ncbi:MAG: DUF362 domain-containing protein, partial [Victivallales bacterium]|nr:DUF362 domain-containing protein [Victivallales bacterium]